MNFFKKKRGSKAKFQVNDETSDFGEIKEISGPTGFKHNWHVGFDSKTGEFNGLPPAWTMWLQASNIR
jgi:hypothetical protein